jgi:hypothetical protein
MPTRFDVSGRRRTAQPMQIEAVEFEAVAIRSIRNLLGEDHEVAFRLLCLPSAATTTLRVTADLSGVRRGKGLDVAPADADGRPCLFAHTHTCRGDRRHSPPSLNDFVSLINDCVIRYALVPIAVVAACERGGGRLYLYDCVSCPAEEVDPVSAADLKVLAEAAAEAARQKQSRHTEALEAVRDVLEARGGRPFDLLRWLELNRRPCPRWVEHVAGAALATDSRCELDFPEWMERYIPLDVLERRDRLVAEQLRSVDVSRESCRHLRGWHAACRDVLLTTDTNLVVHL